MAEIQETAASGRREEMPNPTEEEQASPIFDAIWQVTKRWDVNAPEFYDGYCGMNGSHVTVILRAITAAHAEMRAKLLADVEGETVEVCPDCGHVWKRGQDGSHSCVRTLHAVLAGMAMELDERERLGSESLARTARLEAEVRKLRAKMLKHAIGRGDAEDQLVRLRVGQGAYQEDLAAILRALGLSDSARPVSPREVVRGEVLPAIERLRALVARIHADLGRRESEARARFGPGDVAFVVRAELCQTLRGFVAADADGQRAAEWLEGEKERAAREWRILALNYWGMLTGTIPSDIHLPADICDGQERAEAWLEEQRAAAREEGRREGMAFAANVERHGGTMGEGMEIECAVADAAALSRDEPRWECPRCCSVNIPAYLKSCDSCGTARPEGGA